MVAAILFFYACGAPGDRPGGGEARARANEVDPCAGEGFEIDAPAPSPGGPIATLTVRRAGEGMSAAEKRTCLRVGDRVHRVAPGVERSVEIAADDRSLQRLRVNRRTVLIRVRPRARLTIADHPCFFWQITGLKADAWQASRPEAYCASKPDEPCAAGYFRPGSPRPVEDPVCGGDTDGPVRCVARARVALARAPATTVVLAEESDPVPIARLAAGAALEIEPRDCGFATIDTGREVAELAIEVGDRWLLEVDASGRLRGTAK